MKWHTQLADDLGKIASVRPRDTHILPQLMQAVCKLDALIIRATAGQQRVEMQDARRANPDQNQKKSPSGD